MSWADGKAKSTDIQSLEDAINRLSRTSTWLAIVMIVLTLVIVFETAVLVIDN